MIDFSNKEYAAYNNDMALFNESLDTYAKWFVRTHREGEELVSGMYLSAYGIAVSPFAAQRIKSVQVAAVRVVFLPIGVGCDQFHRSILIERSIGIRPPLVFMPRTSIVSVQEVLTL